MRRQWRMEQHRTQEEKMNHQHPSDRTQAAGLPPVFKPGLSAGDPPTTQKMQNEPNLPHPRASIPRNEPNLHPAHDPNTQNEPNLPPGHTPKYAKRTQFHPRRTRGGPENRNEPNSARPTANSQQPEIAKRTQFQPPRACGSPRNAKRTQFTPATPAMSCRSATFDKRRPVAYHKYPKRYFTGFSLAYGVRALWKAHSHRCRQMNNAIHS